MRYGLLLLLLVLPLLANADIYQWTDSQGEVHFTDVPTPGAKPVDLGDDAMPSGDNSVAQPASVDKSMEAKASAAAASDTTAKSEINPGAAKTSGSHSYTNLAIVQPQNEASFFNNNGAMDLKIDIKPDLKEGDKIVVLIDGSPVSATINGTLLNISGVGRGTHTAAVQIVDGADNVLKQSNSVTFYMHQASLNSPTRKAQPLLLNTKAAG